MSIGTVSSRSIWTAALVLMGVWTCAVSAADRYPSRPLRIVAPFGAGGSYDALARVLAQKLTEQLGQQVVVDNRPGAMGRIGMEIGVKAAPDGYTMITIGTSQTIVPSVFAQVPYDLTRSITPLMLYASITYTLVLHPSVPAQSVSELVALAKSKPGTIRFGHGGTGGIGHLAEELFNTMTGVNILHVPYKSGALGLTATLGGEVQANIVNLLNALPHIQSGRLKGLAVTGLKRSPFVPSLPTLDELGLKGYEIAEFHALAFPANTPKATVMRMHGELTKALTSDDVKQRFSQQTAEIVITSPEEFRAFLVAEQAKYARIVKAIGLKPE